MPRRPLLLDLCCCAGGASTGYYRAGFDVIGVDISPQPRYQYPFILGDVLRITPDWVATFDAVHASPPCQAYSQATTGDHDHPRLIEPIRALLTAAGRPAVIENVVGAPLSGPILCGSMFGLATERLELRRHRRFEAIGWDWPLLMPACGHGQRTRVAGVYGGGGWDREAAAGQQGRPGFRGGFTPDADTRRQLMGMPWASKTEVGEAIPPAYTEYIGGLLLAHLAEGAVA